MCEIRRNGHLGSVGVVEYRAKTEKLPGSGVKCLERSEVKLTWYQYLRDAVKAFSAIRCSARIV